MQERIRKSIPLLISILVGIALLFIPLLGDLHLESAVAVSLIGCLWAGLRACSDENSLSKDFKEALGISGILFLIGVPLFAKSVIDGCFSIDGLAYWLLFPLPSIFFGYAIGRLLRSWRISYRRLLIVTILLGIGVIPFVYELLNFPQLYFFNHVWGGWAGPIYDKIIQITEATVFYRLLTICWALLLWNIPTLQQRDYSRWIVLFSTFILIIGYTQLSERGIVTPRSYLKTVLEGRYTTRHFDIYYDKELYTDYEISLLAREHEFHLSQIQQNLELSFPDTSEKIESYLYGHPWQKKELTGAKFTSFVPVWLNQDQLHIAKPQIPHSLKHELVHVLMKQEGNKLFNASWSIGLTEGVAVALSGGTSVSTVDHIVAADKPYPTAEELRTMITPFGFYSGRSNVNYLTGGSFVRFLIRSYPPEYLKEAYRTGNIPNAFATDWQTLTNSWHKYLEELEIDALDKEIAEQLFKVPSLFEQRCPHVPSKEAVAWDKYQHGLARKDTSAALASLDPLIIEKAQELPSFMKADWSFYQLQKGNPEFVNRISSLSDSGIAWHLISADAYALVDEFSQAESHIKRAARLIKLEPDSLLGEALRVRQEREQWEIHRQLIYRNKLPERSSFLKANHRTKIRTIQKSLERERWDTVIQFTNHLTKLPLALKYFEEYLKIIHHIAFLGEPDLALKLAEKLQAMELRPRYNELLEEEMAWISFLKDGDLKPYIGPT